LKLEGNNHFRSKAWEEALAQYKSALGHLPRRESEPLQEPVEPPELSDPDAVGISTPETLPATPPQQKNEESPEIIKARAVLNANVGACYVQLVGISFCVTMPYPKSTRRRESTKRPSKHARRVGSPQCTWPTLTRLIRCLIALVDDPHYVKALQRRAASNEIIASWSALTSAQEGTTANPKSRSLRS